MLLWRQRRDDCLTSRTSQSLHGLYSSLYLPTLCIIHVCEQLLEINLTVPDMLSYCTEVYSCILLKVVNNEK
jgi:hypothetical protein